MPYRQQIVTYIDILGFKDIVDSRDPGQIMMMLTKFTDYNTRTDQEAKLFNARTIVFSDGVIRWISPGDQEGPFRQLYYELIELAWIQASLIADYEVFLRGGITLGNVDSHDEKSIVFGKGVNRAVELENRTAKFPRIVVDPCLVLNFRRLHTDAGCSDPEIESNLQQIMSKTRTDSDGISFVDYLTAPLPAGLEPADLLAKHKVAILRAAERVRYDNDPDVLNKYRWVAKYHNDSIKRREGLMEGRASELTIEGELLQ